jgi:uncharacterized protein
VRHVRTLFIFSIGKYCQIALVVEDGAAAFTRRTGGELQCNALRAAFRAGSERGVFVVVSAVSTSYIDPMKHQITDIAPDVPTSSPKKRRSMGLGRTARFHFLKILRLRASPHAVATGVAAGAFAAFLPFIGVHMALSVALAWLLGGNMIAAAASTVLIGNPFTYPFIWAATWELGQLILGSNAKSMGTIHLHELFHKMSLSELWGPILKPLLVGFVPLGAIGAVLSYVIVLNAVRIFRARRQARLNAR